MKTGTFSAVRGVPGIGSAVRMIVICLAPIVFGACEAVFTFSPFSFLQRSPENLSSAEKKTYAQDALNSSDPETVKDAYAAIDSMIAEAEGEEKVELQKLAADLAFKASGVTDTVADLTDSIANVDLQNPNLDAEQAQAIKNSVIASAEKNMDEDFIEKYVEQINSLPPEEVTAEDYAYGAVGLLLSNAEIREELKKPDPVLNKDDPVVKEATALLEKSKTAPASEDGSTSNTDLAALLLQYGALSSAQS